MADVKLSGAQAIKDFFGTPDKPVTNQELIALRKADAKGYTELAELATVALN